MSYPALYTHVKTKHEGKFPEGTDFPNSNSKVRGRPRVNIYFLNAINIYIYISANLKKEDSQINLNREEKKTNDLENDIALSEFI